MSRLCIFCRTLEPGDQSCPKLRDPVAWKPQADPSDLNAGPSFEDGVLLTSLQAESSGLCPRCSAYDLRAVFHEARPLDPDETNTMEQAAWDAHTANEKKYRLDLGRLSALRLESKCPFCRLLYSIFPRNPDPEDEFYSVLPFRSYVQETGWDTFPPEKKDRCALFLGLHRISFNRFTSGSRIGDHGVRKGIMSGPAITLDGQEGRVNKARMVEKSVGIAALRARIEDCWEKHGDACKPYKAKEVLAMRMIDVRARKVVPCPKDCDYAALSYVWGGIYPNDGALESQTLPQTIEDAITVTRELGLQYLWVDALCIDQLRNPTPEQLVAKHEQLSIMDRIYAGASVTLAILGGSSSDTGIPGVSPRAPRPQQVKEDIEGLGTLFTVPPHWTLAAEASTWYTRAWTLQESVLSKRNVYFCEEQWHFACPQDEISETMDPSTAVQKGAHPAVLFLRLLLGDSSDGEAELVPTHGGRFEAFASLLESYTERQMSYDSDSLNAILGILSAFTRGLFPAGFIQGLPLRTHPYALGWMHIHSVTPRRRIEFPSWSWAGWEGTVRFPGRLLLEPSTGGYPVSDLEPELVAHEGNGLRLNAWVVELEVVTEPFSEVRIPGGEGTTGFVTERNFPHPTTLPSEAYSCLVVQRVRYEEAADGQCKQTVILVVLDWDEDVASRRTLITLEVKVDLMRFGAEKREVTLV